MADGKSVKSCVIYLTKIHKISPGSLQLLLLRGSHQKSARASPQECNQSSPDFIKIGSLLAELYSNL